MGDACTLRTYSEPLDCTLIIGKMVTFMLYRFYQIKMALCRKERNVTLKVVTHSYICF
jgi:hypothetical protein